MTTTTVAVPRTGGFLRAYVVTMRPYLLPVSCITGLAGLAFAPEASPPLVTAVAVASFLSYGFGQALTDCFQQDTDRLSAPYRPLVQGTITPRQVAAVSLTGLAACVAVFALLNPWTVLPGIAAALGLLTYTPLKRRWWAGPWYNAWIVLALFWMGLLAGVPRMLVLTPQTAAAGCAVFFGYANFVLAGYFKDIGADRATGYRTAPVVFGRTRAAWASHLLAVLFLGSALAASDTVSTPALWFLGGGAGALVSGQVLLHRTRRDAEAHRPVSLTVYAYILLISAVTVTQRPGWTAGLVLLTVAFHMLMAARPERTQV